MKCVSCDKMTYTRHKTQAQGSIKHYKHQTSDNNATLTTMNTTSKIINKVLAPSLQAAVHLRSSNIKTDLAKSSAALLSSAPSGGKHTLPDLPYDYATLERTYIIFCVLIKMFLTFYFVL